MACRAHPSLIIAPLELLETRSLPLKSHPLEALLPPPHHRCSRLPIVHSRTTLLCTELSIAIVPQLRPGLWGIGLLNTSACGVDHEEDSLMVCLEAHPDQSASFLSNLLVISLFRNAHQSLWMSQCLSVLVERQLGMSSFRLDLLYTFRMPI